MRQIHVERFAIDFRGEHVHVELLEAVVAEVNLSQREAGEAARGEALQVVLAEIQRLQITQLGQSIGAYLKMWRQGRAEQKER